MTNKIHTAQAFMNFILGENIMKRYLLLASVAGCLLNVGNAMAWSSNETATITVSAKLAQDVLWETRDVDFGNMVLTNPENNDVLATFTNNEISYGSMVAVHGNAEAGAVGISSGASLVTGVTFDEEVALKDGSNNVVAKMISITPSSRTTVTIGESTYPGYYINGSLKLINKDIILDEDNRANGVALSGTMSATLQF